MKYSLIIWYAIILQAITAIVLLFYAEKFNIARLGVFYQIFPDRFSGPILELIAVGLAVAGIAIKFKSNILHLLFFIPQQFFLILTAGSALNYIIAGHYADGVIRPWQFIFLDQLPSLIAATLYLISIMHTYVQENGK